MKSYPVWREQSLEAVQLQIVLFSESSISKKHLPVDSHGQVFRIYIEDNGTGGKGKPGKESDPDRLQADVMLMTKKSNVFIAYR